MLTGCSNPNRPVGKAGDTLKPGDGICEATVLNSAGDVYKRQGYPLLLPTGKLTWQMLPTVFQIQHGQQFFQICLSGFW